MGRIVEVQGVTDLQDAVSVLLRVDPRGEGWSAGKVHRALMAAIRCPQQLDAAIFTLTSAWDANNVWAEDGSLSAGARLAREVKQRKATGDRTVALARALRTMPHTARALAAGRITVDHVDLLSGANSVSRRELFAECESQLVEYCTELSFFHASKAIRYWMLRADAVLGMDDGTDPGYTGREASWGRGIDDQVHVRAILDAVGGAMFVEAWERIEHDLYVDDQKSGNPRSDDQRRADALVEMARRATGNGPDGKQPRPLISVVLGDHTFRRLCELSDGTVVSPAALVPYVDTAVVETVLMEGRFTGVAVSTQRTFTGVLRRVIEVRDLHCQHPSGCERPMSKCDIDHITPHSEGGITSQEDGQLECHPHNRIPDKHNRNPADLTIHDDDPISLRIRERIAGLGRHRDHDPATEPRAGPND
ncbi:hypothetical protein BH24ACT5_BH24ACT5_27760 [soil metagenome]